MIRKYLVCGKQMFLTSKKLEENEQKIPVCELLLPIQLFWELEDLLKKLDYLLASHEDPVVVNDLSARIFRKIVKYVVHEKDRIFIHGKLHGSGG